MNWNKASDETQVEGLLMQLAVWGLGLSGRLFDQPISSTESPGQVLKRWAAKVGGPVIRRAANVFIKRFSQHFMMGENIELAIKNAHKRQNKGYRYSYDSLGEAARTIEDARRYFQSYLHAINVLADTGTTEMDLIERPGISVKLSSLHPRYEMSQRASVVPIVTERLLLLVSEAKKAHISVTIDAEEVARLDMTLEIVERVFSDPLLEGWEGFGLAVQAYQKNAMAIIEWLISLSRRYHRRWLLRLVKGAYWDTEIKQAQVMGVKTYPVFTRKVATDVSYLACAKRILSASREIYPRANA